ncbi:hypothetical protein LOK55_04255 [Microbacterium sp. F2E]|uniref:hypothetical protein n=1 Tax=Microbacterium sp. F2E TaxID=2895284 RepID=UPI001E5F2D64|nr:hypothetical protein [Microbacterium sp. F2E]MCC9053522.1 hypothetical protein [Microbacterium sp. F2E]
MVSLYVVRSEESMTHEPSMWVIVIVALYFAIIFIGEPLNRTSPRYRTATSCQVPDRSGPP